MTATEIPAAGLRIVIVEDNRAAADSMQLLLDAAGHEVRVAYTGPAGVEVAEAWPPDFVLCDIGLPGLDGYGVAAALRRHPATSKVHLIAISAYSSDEARRRVQEVGFERHFIKPVDPDVLLELLAAPDEPSWQGSNV